jgi:hypothetical protein
MVLDNLLGNRQPDTHALVFLVGVKPPEHVKDALAVLFRDADPVIRYSDFPLLTRFRCAQPHGGAAVWVPEFHGIGEQVLDQGA